MNCAVQMPTPAVSVIIPYLNQPEALRKCLDALAAQNDGSVVFETIVVDNGSSELPQALCAAYPGVSLIEEKTPGPGPARSTGARAARADILAFIDSDCQAQSGWIRAIDDYMNRHHDIGVIGGDVVISAANVDNLTMIEAYESIYGYRMQMYIARDGYTATCNMAMRKPVFHVVGDFGGINIAEDVDWGQRATAAGIKLAYAPEARISTPARRDMAELDRKWGRHIAHDFAAISPGPGGKMRWLLRSLTIALSPIAEIPRIVSSGRISGLTNRIQAFICLTRVRMWRATTMISLLIGRDPGQLAQAWRK